MDIADIVSLVSEKFNVDFSDIVPFYHFTSKDFARYYASILNSINNTNIESLKIHNTGTSGRYFLNVNGIEKYTAIISGFDCFDRVIDNVEYLNSIINYDLDSLPEVLPAQISPKGNSLEEKIRVWEYIDKVGEERDIANNTIGDSPIKEFFINDFVDSIQDVNYELER